MSKIHHLKKLRYQMGLTQKELGKILKKSESAISLFESGNRTPSHSTAKRYIELARKCRIKINYNWIWK